MRKLVIVALAVVVLGCSAASPSGLHQSQGVLSSDEYSWCQDHFTRNQDPTDPGATIRDYPLSVEEAAAQLGLTDPNGGDVVAYWLNTYVGDGADDWGASPHPHWDAAYASMAKDTLFVRACQTAYARK